MRTDLVTLYNTAILRDEKIAAQGIEIMIKNGWLEESPNAANRMTIYEGNSRQVNFINTFIENLDLQDQGLWLPIKYGIVLLLFMYLFYSFYSYLKD